MTVKNSAGQSYEPSRRRMATAIAAGPILEVAHRVPGIHDITPDPFDITNHAGNMWGGTAIAIAAAIAYANRNRNNTSERWPTISQESMGRFRRWGAAVVMGATAVINCTTETRWGVQHLPVAEWLDGPNPETLDTVYSTVWGGILSLALWKKVKTISPPS